MKHCLRFGSQSAKAELVPWWVSARMTKGLRQHANRLCRYAAPKAPRKFWELLTAFWLFFLTFLRLRLPKLREFCAPKVHSS